MQTKECQRQVSQWMFWAARFYAQLPSEVQTTHTHTHTHCMKCANAQSTHTNNWCCLLNRDGQKRKMRSKEKDIVELWIDFHSHVHTHTCTLTDSSVWMALWKSQNRASRDVMLHVVCLFVRARDKSVFTAWYCGNSTSSGGQREVMTFQGENLVLG